MRFGSRGDCALLKLVANGSIALVHDKFTIETELQSHFDEIPVNPLFKGR